MPQFLLSRPACTAHHDSDACSFRVAWSINPHMQIGATDPALAGAQHRGLVSALRGVGAQVLQLPFLHGAYDSVFMKDSVILQRGPGGIEMLPATARFRERLAEPAARAAQLNRRGISVRAPLATPLEGGDLVIASHRPLAFMGHGSRTAAASAAPLSRFLGRDVIPLKLVDEALFHLDTALVLLADDTLVLCEEAFDRASLRAIAAPGFRRIIPVPRSEAMQFALNVVEVDGTIVTGTPSPALESLWTELGYRVRVAPLSQFQLAGGSAACLVARVHEPPTAVALTAAA